jgi:hypothetical protein
MALILVMETALRVKAYHDDRRLLENTRLQEKPVISGGKAGLRAMIRTHRRWAINSSVTRCMFTL